MLGLAPCDGSRVTRPQTAVLAFALVVGASSQHLLAAELGDINGDGRVSFADAYLFDEWRHTGDADLEPAPGSDEFLGVFDCSNSTAFPDSVDGDGFWLGRAMPHLIYLESLRRVARRVGLQPLPHFFEEWPEPAEAERDPPEEGVVTVEVSNSIHRDSTENVQINFFVDTPVPLKAFSVVCLAEGLDMRPMRSEEAPRPDRLQTSSEFYLISGGLFAYRSGFQEADEDRGTDRFLESSSRVSVPCTIPRGTEPGTYELRIIDCEVITFDGEVIRPRVADGSLELTERILEGIDQEFPRLGFDVDNRELLGTTELRITEGNGLPGDSSSVIVQMRTSRAVNFVKALIWFDSDVLSVKGVDPLYLEPDDGRVREEYHQINVSNGRSGRGQLFLSYHCSGMNAVGNSSQPYTYGDATAGLRYVTPLDRWVDLYEIRFEIDELVDVEETDVLFIQQGAPDAGNWTTALLLEPYTFPRWFACRDLRPFWINTSSRFTPSRVFIREDLNFEFLRGDANRDRIITLTDPVMTLDRLFRGRGALDCDDAADADDDGEIGLSDAVYSLNHLFAGGAPPPPPFPESGRDPTTDDLTCAEPDNEG